MEMARFIARSYLNYLNITPHINKLSMRTIIISTQYASVLNQREDE